jgi:hypothetical protein
VLSEIVEVVFLTECTCGNCRKGDISSVCITATKIADICNAEGVSTLRENTASWSPNSVSNLIRKEGGEFRARIEKEKKREQKREENMPPHALVDYI